MKMKHFFVILILTISVLSLNKSKTEQISTIVSPSPGSLVQSTNVLSQPAPVGIFARKNLRVSPLENLTPISMGGNKAETNPLISEPNRAMLSRFKKGKGTFQEQPILANNRIAVPSYQSYPSVTTQTVITTPPVVSPTTFTEGGKMVSPKIVSNLSLK